MLKEINQIKKNQIKMFYSAKPCVKKMARYNGLTNGKT